MILVSTLQSLQQPKYQLLLRDINQSSKCSNSQIFDTFHWNHRKELSECSVCHMPTEIMVESSDHKYIAHIQHWILSVSKMILFSGFYRIAQVRFMINCHKWTTEGVFLITCDIAIVLRHGK